MVQAYKNKIIIVVFFGIRLKVLKLNTFCKHQFKASDLQNQKAKVYLQLKRTGNKSNWAKGHQAEASKEID
jgi:hypothetical protein